MNDILEKAPFLLAVLKYYKSLNHKFNCGIFNDKIFIDHVNNNEMAVIDYKNDYKEFLKDIKRDKFSFNDIFITTNEYIAAARLVLLNNCIAKTPDIVKDVKTLSGLAVVNRNSIFKHEKAIIEFERSPTVMFEYEYDMLTTSTYEYKINQIKSWLEKKKLLN